VVFLFTYFNMEDQQRAVAPARAHILILAGDASRIAVRPATRQWIAAFQKSIRTPGK